MNPKEKKKERCPTTPSIPAPSTTRRPGNGFYEYVNQTWLNNTRIQPWRSEFSVSEEIEDQTDRELVELLQDLKQVNQPPNPATAPKDHLKWISQIWHDSIPDREEIYIQTWLSQILQAKTRDDLVNILGQLMRYKVSTLFSIEIQEATRPPYILHQSFVPGNLVLPTIYYLGDKYQHGPVWKAYETLVGTFAIEYGLPFLLHAIDAEKAAAKILDTPFQTVMRKIYGSDFSSMCPDLNWDAFMDGIGFEAGWKKRAFLLDAPERLSLLVRWFSKAPLEEIAGLLSLHILVFAAPYLRQSVKSAADALFQTALRGVKESPTKNVQFLQDLKSILPDALCSLYSEHYKNNTVKRDVEEMVEQIRGAAIDVMRKTQVFTKKTKSKAIEKIRRMKVVVGSSESSDTLEVTYDKDSLLHSIFSILEARSASQLRYVGRPASLGVLSGYPCFAANASYYSESNLIMIPWGILKWPMYCKDAPQGWNYGGIGAVVAHEITHAFDMEGRFYNEKAVYKQWWTRRNVAKFEKATRKVAKFYGKFKHFGIQVDGKRTLSENWADLGGVLIALNAMKATCKPDDLLEAYKQFFIAFAVSWRTSIRRRKMIYAMMTSVHAQSIDRVDRIVPQFQEWVDAFQIQETDTLFLRPADRLKFF